jgi:hypothetical protein
MFDDWGIDPVIDLNCVTVFAPNTITLLPHIINTVDTGIVCYDVPKGHVLQKSTEKYKILQHFWMTSILETLTLPIITSTEQMIPKGEMLCQFLLIPVDTLLMDKEIF